MLKTGHDLSDEEIRSRYGTLLHRGCQGPELIERVLALAGDLSGLKVLDVGCGKGELLTEISRRYARGELYGVDFSTGRIREAAQGVGLMVSLAEADIQRGLPFRARAFDRVFCTDTLEHLRQPESCLREIWRVLKPDGRVILSVPNATGFAPFHRLGPFIPGRWLRGKLLPYEHPSNTDQPIDTCFVYREIMELVRAGEFDVEGMRGYRYLRYLQMLPVVRDIYRCIYGVVESVLPRLTGERFAYIVLMRCRKRAGDA